jgi:hypothetical protein
MEASGDAIGHPAQRRDCSAKSRRSHCRTGYCPGTECDRRRRPRRRRGPVACPAGCRKSRSTSEKSCSRYLWADRTRSASNPGRKGRMARQDAPPTGHRPRRRAPTLNRGGSGYIRLRVRRAHVATHGSPVWRTPPSRW